MLLHRRGLRYSGWQDFLPSSEAGFAFLAGDAYTAIMVTDPEAEDEDPRGGPRVAFQIASSSIIQPAKTSSWQWGLAFVLGVLTIATAFQLGLVANVSMLPKVCPIALISKRKNLLFIKFT